MMQRYLLGSVTATVASVGVVHNLPMTLNCRNKDRIIPARPKTSATTTTRSAKRAEKERRRREEGGAAGITGRVWGRRGCRQRDSISGPSFFPKRKNRFQFCDIENFAKFSPKKNKKEEEKLVEFTLENTTQKKFPIILEEK
jgi:hypothetical protein